MKVKRTGRLVSVGMIFLLLALLSTATLACQPQVKQVFIDVDGGRQTLTTEAETVRQALLEAQITLGPLDRVSPDLYVTLEPGMVITVTRVREELVTRREVIPFERQIVPNEALAPNETRLVQLGVNGEDEITIRVTYENDVEVSRTEVSRRTVIPPVPEIMVVGVKDDIPSTPIEGVIAYMDAGNAWIMRNTSGSRRPLTTDGNLDGRVFSLSANGRWLLYTTPLTDDIEQPLNELWLASTTIVGEAPVTLGIRGVLQAAWSPVVSQNLVALTTAERTPSPPGWKARNDLWLVDLTPDEPMEDAAYLDGLRQGKISRPKPVQVLPPGTPGLYSWWGTTYTWSPRGDRLAYARADEIGLITLTRTTTISASVQPLVQFTPFDTLGEWVWVPAVSWSPDGRFLAAVVHGPPVGAEPAEQSQAFDLWLLSADGRIKAKAVDRVGMWANPVWGTNGIAYGQAVNPLQSVTSRYTIYLMDHDGSNRRQIFPYQTEPGVQFPELVWSPEGNSLLFVFNGNLFLTPLGGGPPRQLTAGSQASGIRWVRPAALNAGLPLTATESLSNSAVLTSGGTITVENDANGTPSAPTVTPTPVRRDLPQPAPAPTGTATAVSMKPDQRRN